MSRKFRVGNDIPINWSLVNEDGSPYIVEGKNFAIELLIGNSKRVRIGGATANENTISFEYLGKDQGPLGSVNLIYIENNGKIDMVTFDTEDAFTMVPHSWLAIDEDETPETITFDVVTIVSETIVIGATDTVKYTPQTLTPEQQVQARANIGAGTYQKPNTGIPATDLAEPVQQELAKADTAYKKPNTGIPAADLAEPVQQELTKADTAYQKPGMGIPKTDLASGIQTSLEKADTAVQPEALTSITSLIPEQATPENKLADKNFVNSSIATNTANYISDNGQPFQSVADLEAYTGTLTNNDYAFVVGTDSAGNTTYTRYKYNATTQTWAEEYVLNNSSFTAAQWAAISSGITALLVQKLSGLPTEIVTYAAQALTDAQKLQARENIGTTRITDIVVLRNWTNAQFSTYAVFGRSESWSIGADVLERISVGDIFTLKATITDRDNCEAYILIQVTRKTSASAVGRTLLASSNRLVPVISTNIQNDRTSNDKVTSTKAVYDEVHPAVASTQPQGGFLPNVFYNLGELTGSVTFSLATPSDNTIVNHYYWTFETGSAAPTITWPNGISWAGGTVPEIIANKHYEVSVLNGIGTFMEM